MSLQQMSLNDNNKTMSLRSGVEITITNKKHDAKKREKIIKATKSSIAVKARIKFAHALKKYAQHTNITPGFNNPQSRGELSQGAHKDSG